MSSGVAIEWRERASPLAPVAVWAEGPARRALLERLLALPGEHRARLRGAASAHVVIVSGEREQLPWVEGAKYLGRDPSAPSLLLPTTLEPSAPASLLERALLARVPRSAIPLAVLLSPARLVPMGEALPLGEARLRAALELAA